MSRQRFKEIELVMANAREQGCRTELTRNGHWKVWIPGGKLVVCPGTASDFRAIRNAKAELRRAGLQV